MKNFKLILLMTVLFSLSAKVMAQDGISGKIKYSSCSGCHGVSGQGGVGPKLQGQKASDIIKKLTAYKNKQKVGPQSELMWGIASGLSTSDISNIAAYTVKLKKND